MTDEEELDSMRAALASELLREESRKAKRRAYHGANRESRWDKIQRDPKAYFTRSRDWKAEEAERFGWDLSIIPKLNVTMPGGVTKQDREDRATALRRKLKGGTL
jgi:hypothetical protein